MALPLFAAAAGIQAASSVGSWWLSRDRARLQRRETDEQLRRFNAEAEQRLGMARAAGAASGVEFESESLQNYLDSMSTEFRRQAEWMRRAGYRGARITEQAGNFGLVSDLGSSMIRFGQSNNWWRGSGA